MVTALWVTCCCASVQSTEHVLAIWCIKHSRSERPAPFYGAALRGRGMVLQSPAMAVQTRGLTVPVVHTTAKHRGVASPDTTADCRYEQTCCRFGSSSPYYLALGCLRSCHRALFCRPSLIVLMVSPPQEYAQMQLNCSMHRTFPLLFGFCAFLPPTVEGARLAADVALLALAAV